MSGDARQIVLNLLIWAVKRFGMDALRWAWRQLRKRKGPPSKGSRRPKPQRVLR